MASVESERARELLSQVDDYDFLEVVKEEVERRVGDDYVRLNGNDSSVNDRTLWLLCLAMEIWQ